MELPPRKMAIPLWAETTWSTRAARLGPHGKRAYRKHRRADGGWPQDEQGWCNRRSHHNKDHTCYSLACQSTSS